MSGRGRTPAASYEIVYDGVLPASTRDELEGWVVVEQDKDGSSRGGVMVGNVVDQAALHGVLDRLEAAGVEVRTITRRPVRGRS